MVFINDIYKYMKQIKAIENEGGERIFELISKARRSQPNHSIAFVEIPAGDSSQKHFHQKMQETYFILSGNGMLSINENMLPVQSGAMVYIAEEDVHQITAGGEMLRFLVFCSPKYDAADVLYV